MNKTEAKKEYIKNPASLLDLNSKSCGGIETVYKKIIAFIRERVGTRRAVMGLSGGIDSTIVAKLAVDALGKEKVIGILMPSDTNCSEDTQYAKEWAEELGIEYKTLNITKIIDAISDVASFSSNFAKGNAKARARMILLYNETYEPAGIVVGTDNKTEGAAHGIGYFTKYGDGGVDINPIGDLYKTQVRQLARFLKCPKIVIERAPAAGLGISNTDEDEFGTTYEILDKILLGYELGFSEGEIAKILKIDKSLVDKQINRHKSSQHKSTIYSCEVINYD